MVKSEPEKRKGVGVGRGGVHGEAVERAQNAWQGRNLGEEWGGETLKAPFLL